MAGVPQDIFTGSVGVGAGGFISAEAAASIGPERNNTGGSSDNSQSENTLASEPTQSSREVRSVSVQNNSELFRSQLQGLDANLDFTGYGRHTYNSFAGSDINVSIAFKGGQPVTVGEAQTVTYSLFRPMNPVYGLGDARPKGYVRGQRTVAGSIIFTVFTRNVLLDTFYEAFRNQNSKCVNREYLTDELPPFDIHMTFMNEYGVGSRLVIHDVRVTTEGQVMSIEDMITENTMQYLATDITLQRPGAPRG